MAVDDVFYLSDDSETSYEQSRAKKIERDGLILDEMKSHLDQSFRQARSKRKPEIMSIPVPSQVHDFVHTTITPTFEKMGHSTTNLGNEIRMLFKNCSSEAIVVCILLVSTLSQMMYATDSPMRSSKQEVDSETPISRLEFSHYDHFIDVFDTHSDEKHDHIPFYWHIPYAFNPLQDVITKCFAAKDDDQTFEGFNVQILPSRTGTTSSSKIISSEKIYSSKQIFSDMKNKKGHTFTLMKHPVQTTFDRYQDYITNGGQLPIEAFIEDEDLYQDNWMTRAITGKTKIKGMLDKKKLEITQEDLDFALEFLGKKVIVGIYPQMITFFGRLESVLPFSINDANVMDCAQSILVQYFNAFSQAQYPLENSGLWATITFLNNYDLQLYKYAMEVFEDAQSQST